MDEPRRLRGGRESPPHFAGRKRELAAFRDKLAGVCLEGGTTGGLQLTVGVPGSGKSQLAREFARHLKDVEMHKRAVHVLFVETCELDNPVSLFLTMGKKIGAEETAKEIAQVNDRIANFSGQAFSIGSAVALDVGRHTPSFASLLRASMDKDMWRGKALVVIIDELQRMSDEGMKPLCVLHDGNHGCPILLLGFGLQHTPSVLSGRADGMTISRLERTATLHPLSRSETYEAFDRGLAWYGYEGVPAKSLERLVAASHCFPEHVNGYIEGAVGLLRESGECDGCALEGDILRAALRHGDVRREAYYEALLDAGESHEPMQAVVDVMVSSGKDSIPYGIAEKAIKAKGEGYGRDDLEAAIKHGSLVKKGSMVSFEVPSFRTYIEELSKRAQGVEEHFKKSVAPCRQ